MRNTSAFVAVLPVGSLVWASLHLVAILSWYEMRQNYTPRSAPCFGLGDIVSGMTLFYLPLVLGLIAAGVPLVFLQVRKSRTLRHSRIKIWFAVLGLWVVAAIVPYGVHVVNCPVGSNIYQHDYVRA